MKGVRSSSPGPGSVSLPSLGEKPKEMPRLARPLDVWVMESRECTSCGAWEAGNSGSGQWASGKSGYPGAREVR